MRSLNSSFITNSSTTVTFVRLRRVRPAKTKMITMLNISFEELIQQHLELHAEEAVDGFGSQIIVETVEEEPRLLAKLCSTSVYSEYEDKREALQKELELLGFSVVNEISVDC